MQINILASQRSVVNEYIDDNLEHLERPPNEESPEMRSSLAQEIIELEPAVRGPSKPEPAKQFVSAPQSELISERIVQVEKTGSAMKIDAADNAEEFSQIDVGDNGPTDLMDDIDVDIEQNN